MRPKPSKQATLVHGKAMGAGAQSLRLPCKSINIPEVFSEPEGKDPFSSLTSHSVGKRLVEKLISNKVFVQGRIDSSHDDDVDSVALNGTTDAHRQPGRLLQLRDAIPGHVPINADGQRLDYYMKRPPFSDKQLYSGKYDTGERQPCKWFHLANVCHYQDLCAFDHSDISTQVRKVLEYTVKRKPCNMGSECRRIDCIYGHVCQDTRCITDGLETCGMKRFHGMDKDFARWVKGKYAPEFPTGVTKEAPAEDGGNATLESSWF
ncbi:hypothetical protein J4E90_008293 [Alternaria incomplexa]|uniref:uncharacterized protein n=1 Tax=Alternaria incomplexa TaxID=1187928 RepID=UPI00221EEB34|nr:uncharacterized protein J4E90_008293 [Alternaria incomplexa]KAI4909595.1 hypothetical protein J4E90_008293 [Alternaria incomplexa]